MVKSKTIAVTEDVWDRLRQVMEREGAKSMNEVLSKLITRASSVPQSSFGVHKKMKLRFSQEEHEEMTRDIH